MGIMDSLLGMFGGAGDVGTTPLTQGVGYSPEIPMSTGIESGMNVPAQPTDASAGVSPTLWQQIQSFLNTSGGDPTQEEIDPKTGKPKDTRQDELAKFGKFLSAAGGMQSQLQNSKLGQQMIQQHVNQPAQQGKYIKPEDMATRLLMQQGLL